MRSLVGAVVNCKKFAFQGFQIYRSSDRVGCFCSIWWRFVSESPPLFHHAQSGCCRFWIVRAKGWSTAILIFSTSRDIRMSFFHEYSVSFLDGSSRCIVANIRRAYSSNRLGNRMVDVSPGLRRVNRLCFRGSSAFCHSATTLARARKTDPDEFYDWLRFSRVNLLLRHGTNAFN